MFSCLISSMLGIILLAFRASGICNYFHCRKPSSLKDHQTSNLVSSSQNNSMWCLLLLFQDFNSYPISFHYLHVVGDITGVFNLI